MGVSSIGGQKALELCRRSLSCAQEAIRGAGADDSRAAAMPEVGGVADGGVVRRCALTQAECGSGVMVRRRGATLVLLLAKHIASPSVKSRGKPADNRLWS